MWILQALSRLPSIAAQTSASDIYFLATMVWLLSALRSASLAQMVLKIK